MGFRIVVPHPLPPILKTPSEASDVLIPGEVELPFGEESTVSSATFTLVQTLRLQTCRPRSSMSFVCFGLSEENDHGTEQTREVDRWCLSYPSTSVRSPTRRVIPFTIVVPGHLAGTTSTPIAELSYHISATVITNTATSTSSNTITKPLHIRRHLTLPVGLTTLDYRRRFPSCNVTTALSVPAIFRPLETCTARLTLLNTAEHWLRVHQIQWHIEECTMTSSPLRGTELESGLTKDCEPNRHIRTIASGKHCVTPTEISALYGSHISDLRLDEIDLDITIPEIARRACTLRRAWNKLAHDVGGEVLPDYTGNSHSEPLIRLEDEAEGAHGTVDSVAPAISVSHTLVLEITGKEIRFHGMTGEQLSLGPLIPRVYGARYDITVSEWSHCGDVYDEERDVSPLAGTDFSAVGPALPPAYESVIHI